jgi:uncharacterized protein YjbI with pentapeptide repeats
LKHTPPRREEPYQLAAAEEAFCDGSFAGVDFREANLENAKLSGITLRCADLSSGNLAGATFARVDLSEANLRNATFYGTSFVESTLIGVSGTHDTKHRGPSVA